MRQAEKEKGYPPLFPGAFETCTNLWEDKNMGDPSSLIIYEWGRVLVVPGQGGRGWRSKLSPG
jgi:hypothetical protein